MGLATTVLGGVVFGLALAAPPGPMNAVIAQESVFRGWTAGFRAGLGAMLADACFFGLALLGAATVLRRRPTVRTALLVAGGLLMLYFAAGAIRDAQSFAPATESATGNGFKKAFVLALTNPYQIVFWLTVGIGLLQPGRLDVLATLPVVGRPLTGLFVVTTGDPTLIVGLFAGIVVWITGFPATLVRARRRVESLAPAVAWLSAAVLAGFGLVFLGNAAGRL